VIVPNGSLQTLRDGQSVTLTDSNTKLIFKFRPPTSTEKEPARITIVEIPNNQDGKYAVLELENSFSKMVGFSPEVDRKKYETDKPPLPETTSDKNHPPAPKSSRKR